jgi:alkylation response protein AidB-like acyl-CoA dehydrogenase
MQYEHWKQAVDQIGPAFADRVAERDATDTFAAESYPSLKESGLLAMLVPSELGGGGASHRSTCWVLRDLARHDPSTALAFSMHQHLVAAQVVAHRGGQERATKLLERVARDQLVLVSTGARDWLESNGRMERVEGGFRVTARKAFASGSPVGDLLVTSAPYEHPEDGWQVLHFAVPLAADGVAVGSDWVAHGMRATGSHTVELEGVFVPDGAIALARPRGAYHGVWSVVLTVALPLISAVYVGIAQAAAELARPLAAKRADDAATVMAMGEADSARIVAETLLEGLIARAEGLSFTPSVALSNEVVALKTATVEAAHRTVRCACDAAGGPAYYRRTGLERLLRDVQAGQYHPLQPRAQVLFTGRVGLGLDPAG